MFPRLLRPPHGKSFFLFGPRGTGKSSWVRQQLPGALVLDLLESDVYLDLLASPQRLEQRIPPNFDGWVVLDEVHRLIERKRLRFALTGSSARKLRHRGTNLLAGRALTLAMHPLTVAELGDEFELKRSLELGQLPVVQSEGDRALAKAYLSSYVRTYLREEVLQEGLTRNLAAFTRFLEAASFSQASPLNMSAVARDCQVERKVVEDYFSILEDLMLGVRIPVFTRRAQRAVITHPKFYFFDVGVFRTLRPRGPLDSAEEIDGASIETLVLQEIRAQNDYLGLGYSLHYWRTRAGEEVDIVLYGERGLHAIEVKRASRIRREDMHALQAFLVDYPMAHAWLVYGGRRSFNHGRVNIVPLGDFLRALPSHLGAGEKTIKPHS